MGLELAEGQLFGDRKSLPIAKFIRSLPKNFVNKLGLFITKTRAFVRIHTKKFTQSSPKAWEDEFLGILFLAPNYVLGGGLRTHVLKPADSKHRTESDLHRLYRLCHHAQVLEEEKAYSAIRNKHRQIGMILESGPKKQPKHYAAPIGAFFCPEIRAFTGLRNEISSTVSKVFSDRKVLFKHKNDH